jgi:hypothetical protein
VSRRPIIFCIPADAVLECGCNGETLITGKAALTEYWRSRFAEKSAGVLERLQVSGEIVVVSYAVPHGIVQANPKFDDAGRIVRTQCGPL